MHCRSAGLLNNNAITVRWSTKQKDGNMPLILGGLHMNKAELIAAVAEKTGLTKKDSEQAVNAAFDIIVDTLVSGEKVQMVGFGVFDVKERGVRKGRNPKTKEEIEIPATRVPFFKAGKAMKDAVAK